MNYKDECPLSGKEMDDVLKAVNTVQKHQSEINLDDTEYDEEYKEGHEDGLAHAWECARIILNMSKPQLKAAGFHVNDIQKTSESRRNIILDYSANEALEKIKAYEQRLEVGDEVIHKTITKCKPHIITQIRAEWVGVLSDNGYPLTWEKKKVVKTGKHYELQSILDGLKEDS